MTDTQQVATDRRMIITSFEGKSAVVAAGAKNLGGSISTTLAGRGVNVAVHYNSDNTEPDADKTVAAVEAAGAKAVKFQGEQRTDDELIRRERHRFRKLFGQLPFRGWGDDQLVSPIGSVTS